MRIGYASKVPDKQYMGFVIPSKSQQGSLFRTCQAGRKSNSLSFSSADPSLFEVQMASVRTDAADSPASDLTSSKFAISDACDASAALRFAMNSAMSSLVLSFTMSTIGGDAAFSRSSWLQFHKQLHVCELMIRSASAELHSVYRI